MTGFTLREAAPADVADIFRLMRDFAEYERLLDRFTATAQDYAHILFGPAPLAHAILAESGGRPVGIALWYFALSSFAARPILYLEDIFVEPAHRRNGIGLAFFRRLAAIARDTGCYSMDWNVLRWNQPAIDFYARLGAKPIAEWMGHRLDAEGIRALAGS